MEYNYRNVNEIIIEDLLSSSLLNVIPDDDLSLIEDVICLTLSNVPARYIRHHIDFSYSKSISPEYHDELSSNIASLFNSNISKLRGQEESKDWK